MRLMFLHSIGFYLGPKFLENGSQSSLNGSPQNLHTCLVWDKALKPTFKTFSSPLLMPGFINTDYSQII